MIPPALVKVRKPVSECNFKHFEHNRTDPADFCISDDKDFEPPPKEVSNEVDIIDGVKEILEQVRVLRGEKAAVFPIVFVWQTFSKFWVVMNHEFSSFIEG